MDGDEVYHCIIASTGKLMLLIIRDPYFLLVEELEENILAVRTVITLARQEVNCACIEVDLKGECFGT